MSDTGEWSITDDYGNKLYVDADGVGVALIAHEDTHGRWGGVVMENVGVVDALIARLQELRAEVWPRAELT